MFSSCCDDDGYCNCYCFGDDAHEAATATTATPTKSYVPLPLCYYGNDSSVDICAGDDVGGSFAGDDTEGNDSHEDGGDTGRAFDGEDSEDCHRRGHFMIIIVITVLLYVSKSSAPELQPPPMKIFRRMPTLGALGSARKQFKHTYSCHPAALETSQEYDPMRMKHRCVSKGRR